MEAVSLTGPRLTEGYRPTVYIPPSRWRDHGAIFPDWDLEEMRRDPRVQLGLGVLKGPAHVARLLVDSPQEEVKTWVAKQFEHIWQTELGLILLMLDYGIACGEATLRDDPETGLADLDALHHVRYSDAKPLEWDNGAFAGIRVRNTTKSNVVDVPSPRCYWIANEPEFNPYSGRSRLWGAWEPWKEKSSRHGAKDSRRTWYLRNAFSGIVIRHPPGKIRLGDDSEMSNQDYARQIAELYENGGVLALPSARDEVTREFLWEVDWPKVNGDIGGIREYVKDLDDEIFQGMRILKEVIEAAESGSGWAGRTVPFLVYLTDVDRIVRSIVSTLDEQIIRPVAERNFGIGVKYTVKPISLVPKDRPEGAKDPGNVGGAMGGQQQEQPQPGQAYTGPRGGHGTVGPDGKVHYGHTQLSHERDEDTGDDAQALASWYADILNLLGESGMDAEGMMQGIHEELADSGWYLVQGEDGAWHATKDDEGAVRMSFNPQEARDESGKWTAGGAKKGRTKEEKRAARQMKRAHLLVHEPGAKQAKRHRGELRKLLRSVREGNYDAADLLEDANITHEQSTQEARKIFSRRYKTLLRDVRKAHGEEAIASPEWQAVKNAYNEAHQSVLAAIDEMTDTVRSLSRVASHRNASPEVEPGHVEQIDDDYNKLVETYEQATGKIAQAVNAYRDKHGTKGLQAWQLSHVRAPVGGVTINGKGYRGGQFIPSSQVKAVEAKAASGDAAAKEDLEKIEAAKAGHQAKAQERTQARQARQVSPSDVLGKLVDHSRVELTPAEQQQAGRSFRMFQRHHGELALHRLDEVADGLLKALAGVQGNPGLRDQLSRKLRQVQEMVGLAEKAGPPQSAREKALARHPESEGQRREDDKPKRFVEADEQQLAFAAQIVRQLKKNGSNIEQVMNRGLAQDLSPDDFAKKLRVLPKEQREPVKAYYAAKQTAIKKAMWGKEGKPPEATPDAGRGGDKPAGMSKPERSAALANIGFVLNTGRANLDVEQAAMQAVGADSLTDLAAKLKAGSDEDIRKVAAIVKGGASGSVKSGLEQAAGVEAEAPKPSEKSAEAPKAAPAPKAAEQPKPKKQPHEMTKEERQAEIARIKEEKKSVLATPLMSDGNISPFQVGQMSPKQREKYQANAQERMRLESHMRELGKSDEELQAGQKQKSLSEAKSRVSQINRQLNDADIMGKGKSGKLKPTWQRSVDAVTEELRKIVAEHPEALTDYPKLAERLKPAEQPKAKAEKPAAKPTPAPAPKSEHGEAGAAHPLAGLDDKAKWKKMGDFKMKFMDGDNDAAGLKKAGPPPGLDLKAFGDAAASAVARHSLSTGSPGQDIGKVYDDVGKQFGLSKHDFQRAIVALHGDALSVKGGNFGIDYMQQKNIDPDLVTPTRGGLAVHVGLPSEVATNLAKLQELADRGSKQPKPQAHSPADVRAALPDAADAVKKASGPAGVVKIPELHDELVKRFPGLTREQFHGILNDMAKNDEAVLQVSNDPRLEARAEEGIDSPRGKLLTLKLRDSAKSSQPTLTNSPERSTVTPETTKEPSGEKKVEATKQNTPTPLKGSEKQVAWAEKIRSEILAKVPEEHRAAVGAIAEAKHWIDYKTNSPSDWVGWATPFDVRILKTGEDIDEADDQEKEGVLEKALSILREAGLPVSPTIKKNTSAADGFPTDLLPLLRPVASSEEKARRLPPSFWSAEARKMAFLERYKKANEQYFASWRAKGL